MSLTSEVVRRTFKASDDKRDKGLKTPEDIERFDDIVYGENEKWNLFRFSLSKSQTQGEIQ